MYTTATSTRRESHNVSALNTTWRAPEGSICAAYLYRKRGQSLSLHTTHHHPHIAYHRLDCLLRGMHGRGRGRGHALPVGLYTAADDAKGDELLTEATTTPEGGVGPSVTLSMS